MPWQGERNTWTLTCWYCYGLLLVAVPISHIVFQDTLDYSRTFGSFCSRRFYDCPPFYLAFYCSSGSCTWRRDFFSCSYLSHYLICLSFHHLDWVWFQPHLFSLHSWPVPFGANLSFFLNSLGVHIFFFFPFSVYVHSLHACCGKV